MYNYFILISLGNFFEIVFDVKVNIYGRFVIFFDIFVMWSDFFGVNIFIMVLSFFCFFRDMSYEF